MTSTRTTAKPIAQPAQTTAAWFAELAAKVYAARSTAKPADESKR